MPGKKQEKERKRKEAAAMCIRLVFMMEWKESKRLIMHVCSNKSVSISVLVMNAKEMLFNLLFSSKFIILYSIIQSID